MSGAKWRRVKIWEAAFIRWPWHRALWIDIEANAYELVFTGKIDIESNA